MFRLADRADYLSPVRSAIQPITAPPANTLEAELRRLRLANPQIGFRPLDQPSNPSAKHSGRNAVVRASLLFRPGLVAVASL